MTYLLDTNICVFAVKQNPIVIERLSAVSPDDIYVSSVSIAEIWYGIEKSQQKIKNEQVWSQFFELIETKPFGEEAAKRYATLRATLEQKGKMIGNHDCMIASVALVHDFVLVTNNTREFHRVPDLQIEDWTKG